MKKKILITAVVLFLLLLLLPFIFDSETLNKFNSGISLISGLATFVTVIIAALLFDKYGVDKSIKDKNLESALNLLETIKSTTILIKGNNYVIQYRPTTFPMQTYESSYQMKIAFSNDYLKQTRYLVKFVDNVFLPKQIRNKLNIITPHSISHVPNTTESNEYGIVNIGKQDDKHLNWSIKESKKQLDNKAFGYLNGRELTVYDYLLMWEELIEAIQDWCSKSSDSKLDLNVD